MQIPSSIPSFNPKDMTRRESVLLFLAVLMFFVPGAAVIFFFFPDLFDKFDVAKILLLSAAITTPSFFVILVSTSHGTSDAEAKKHDFHFFSAWMSVVAASLAIYAAMAVAFFKGFSFKPFLATLAGFTVLTAFISYRAAKSESKPVHPKP